MKRVDAVDLLPGLVRRLRRAEQRIVICTANAKDVHFKDLPLLEVLAERAAAGVPVLFMVAGVPSAPFSKRFLETDGASQIAMRFCPRTHQKFFWVDGYMLFGSANFTGAALGSKAEGRGNFEQVFETEDTERIAQVLSGFPQLWRGDECAGCDRWDPCADLHQRWADVGS